MKNQPLVSVLMPAYNQADYVAEALDSLLAQTYRNWEVAVVDDGSPDRVAEIVAPYAERDSRIRFYHTENRGVSGARNFASSVTSGDLILPLDADNILLPDFIEACVAEFDKNPDTRLVYTDWEWFGAQTGGLDNTYRGYVRLLVDNVIDNTAMYRREDFLRVGGYDSGIPYGYEDWEFWIRLLDRDARVSRIPRKLFRYRIRAVSRNSVMKQEEKRQASIDYIRKKHARIYQQHIPDFIDKIRELGYLEYRGEKWARRSLWSRLWYAFKGKI